MAASDVADEVWPTMARSMQKYLRTTRWEIESATKCPISPGLYGCPIRLGVCWTSLDINFRQHEHYNREACLDHLSFCFRHNMGAPAFVNRYVNKRPAIAYPGLTGPGLGLRYRVKRTGRSLIILFRSFDEEYALVNFIRSSAPVFNPTWNYFPAHSGIILKPYMHLSFYVGTILNVFVPEPALIETCFCVPNLNCFLGTSTILHGW